MTRSVIQLLKSGVRFTLAKVGYSLVRLPKGRPVSPESKAASVDQSHSGFESRNPHFPDESEAFASVAAEVVAIRRLKQEAFEHTIRHRGSGFGPDFLDPFGTLVHLQHQYRQDLKIDHQPAIRVISGDWLKNIGQIAHLDIYFKLKALKMLEESDTIICLDGVTPVSQSLLSYFAPYASRIVPNKTILGELAEYMELLEESTVTARLADGNARHYHSLFYDVGAVWQQQARAPLVSLRPAHRAKGRRWLWSLGLPDDGWFATFHCRTTVGHQDIRSVRTETYLPAMEAVVRAGGWVVCMGSDHQFANPKIINRESHRTPNDDWKDVFLIAGCRFFVGCTSGPADVANAFGVHSVKANTTDIGKQAAYNHDLFIPKLFRFSHSGRLLTMAEVLEHVGTACGFETSHIAALGIDLIDNTPEEIKAVVCEMMERLERVATVPAPWEEAAQQRLREFRQTPAIGHGPIMAGKTRMGRDFLRRHGSALGLIEA